MVIPFFLPDSNESRDVICELLRHGVNHNESAHLNNSTMDGKLFYIFGNLVTFEQINHLALSFRRKVKGPLKVTLKGYIH